MSGVVGQPIALPIDVPFRAVPRGLTASSDASAAIQAIHDNLYTAYGCGALLFPEGTFRCNLILNERMQLRGAGWRATTLKSVASSGGDVIKGKDFATLTGKAKATGDYLRGAYGCVIRDLTVDGDKSTQSAGYGIRLWGAHPTIENVIVKNCKNDGIWNEFTDHDNFTDNDEHVQAILRNIKSIGNDGNGWTYRGPHDSYLSEYVAFNNAGWALKTESTSGGYTGGISIAHANSFLNTTGSYYFGAGSSLVDAIASAGNVGTGIEIASGVGLCKMESVTISGHTTGLLLRGSDHRFTGVIQTSKNAGNTDGAAVQIDGAARCVVRATGSGNVSVLYVTPGSGESGPNEIHLNFGVSSGKKFLKTADTPTFADLSRANVVALTNYSVSSDWTFIQSGAAGNAHVRKTPLGDTTILERLAIATNSGMQSSDPTMQRGTGSPEGVVTARIGSLYFRTDGGASTTLYVKESGTGSTGWVAK